nr:hypothetical protein [Nocardiopsis composta]
MLRQQGDAQPRADRLLGGLGSPHVGGRGAGQAPQFQGGQLLVAGGGARFAEQEALAGQLTGVQRPGGAGQPVAGVRAQQQAVAEQRLDQQLRRRGAARDHRQADLALQQSRLHLPAVADEQVELHPRELLAEPGGQAGQQVGADGGGAAHPQPPGAQALDLLDRGDRLLGEQQQAAGVLRQRLPLGGGADPRPGAVDQGGAHRRLQLLHLRGDRRLAHVQLLRRRGEAAVLQHPQEDLQPVQVQMHPRPALPRVGGVPANAIGARRVQP